MNYNLKSEAILINCLCNYFVNFLLNQSIFYQKNENLIIIKHLFIMNILPNQHLNQHLVQIFNFNVTPKQRKLFFIFSMILLY